MPLAEGRLTRDEESSTHSPRYRGLSGPALRVIDLELETWRLSLRTDQTILLDRRIRKSIRLPADRFQDENGLLRDPILSTHTLIPFIKISQAIRTPNLVRAEKIPPIMRGRGSSRVLQIVPSFSCVAALSLTFEYHRSQTTREHPLLCTSPAP